MLTEQEILAGKIIGRRVRMKTSNPKYPNYLVYGHPNLDLVDNAGGTYNSYINEPWTVFNIVPGLSGRGVSFQSAADSDRFIYASDTRLSLNTISLGLSSADRAAQDQCSWLPL